MAHKKKKTKQQQIQSAETQQPAIVDLTEFYDKEISIDDVWNNINSIAGKKLLPTAEDNIYFSIVDTNEKKTHFARGGGKNNLLTAQKQKIYLMHLNELTKHAHYVGTDNNAKFHNKRKKGTALYHYFETPVRIHENVYKLRFVTEEYTEKEFERLKKIGKLPQSSESEVSFSISNLPSMWLNLPNNYSISNGKNLSSHIPKIVFLYDIKEVPISRTYSYINNKTVQKGIRSNQIQTSQNQSPIQMDIRPMQNKTEENKMQKQNYYTNLKNFVSNSGGSLGRVEIAVDRENGTITVEQRGEQPVMQGAEMNWNGFSLVDFERQDENTRYHKYTAELNEQTAAFAEEIRKKTLNNITPEDYEATTEYPESEALSKAGWEWVRYQDGSGGFHDKKRLAPYDIGYDATTNEGWLKDKNRNETDFFYRTGYDDEGVEIFDLEKFKATAEEKIANLLNINIEQENAMEKQNEQTQEIEQTVTNFLIEKVRKSGLNVIIDKQKMREVLDSGQYVQAMAAYHGTSHEGEIDNAFNGFGTYVVSVNTDTAKQQGKKIAAKKYGDAFYIKSNGQELTLDKFLSEHGYSSYWNELLKQTHFDDIAKLQHEIIASDTKGNAELEGQKTNLSVLLSAGVIEYKREKTYLYSIDIPDNNGKNYLFYEKSIGLDAANNINAALEKMGVEWRVDRRDAGRQVYFNTLSEKVFNGNQERTSKFLKDIGYAGMEMNSSNYIMFDEKDIVVNERVQYMIDGKNNILGLVAGNNVLLDEDYLNSETPAHEYNHIWDAYIRRTNPELVEKGIGIFKQTMLWDEIQNHESYKQKWSNLSTQRDEHGISEYDYEIFSEAHSRVVGKFASEVLARIAVENGGKIVEEIIDWDKEAKEYIAREFGNDFPEPKLGSDTYEYDIIKRQYIQDFFAQPMKDLMNGKNITQEIAQEQSVQKMVSNEVSENSDFFNAVEDYVKKGIKPFHNEFLLKNTPAILQYAEIPNHEIVLSTGVINKAKKTHNLSDEEILSALKGLSDPILIFDSDKEKSEAKENSVLIFTETSDENGHPIAIGFEMSAQRKEMKTEFIINQIHSIHPRTTLINSNNENMLEKWTEKGLMKYVDDKKYQAG